VPVNLYFIVFLVVHMTKQMCDAVSCKRHKYTSHNKNIKHSYLHYVVLGDDKLHLYIFTRLHSIM